MDFVFALCSLLLITTLWAGGEWMFSVNMTDHHTSCHMPGSMMDSCSLSWTKWELHAFELDKGLVYLPDGCLTDVFISLHLQEGRVFLFPFSGFLMKMQTQCCRDSPMWPAERIWAAVTWSLYMHVCMLSPIHFTHLSCPLPPVPLITLLLLVHLSECYTTAQWSKSNSLNKSH